MTAKTTAKRIDAIARLRAVTSRVFNLRFRKDRTGVRTTLERHTEPSGYKSGPTAEKDWGSQSRWQRALPSVLNWGSYAVLAMLLAAVAWMVLAPHLLDWRYGILRSGSMSPDYPTGAAIVVAPMDPDDIATGDVITFRSATDRDVIVTHRVLDIETGTEGQLVFTTQGDANNTPDEELLTPDRVMGRVVFGVPYVGQVVSHLRGQAAFILLMVLPAAAIIGMELKEFASGVRDLRQNRRKATS